MSKKRVSYKDAGVNLEAAESSVESIKKKVDVTSRPEVMSKIGGFSGLFALDVHKYKEPVLVSGTDGVGTKLKLAFNAGIHDTVGIDLVAMCVNDILVMGAEPLFFLDYLAVGELQPQLVDEIVDGIVEGCRQSNCALLGGETAEMPGFYTPGEYDMAGFVVGVVEKEKIIDGSSIEPGDIVLGLSSSGLHSNGFSLVRKVLFENGGLSMESIPPELGSDLGSNLLVPTRIYVSSILPLSQEGLLKGMAHITGGGILQNLARVLPSHCNAVLERNWEIPAIFNFIQDMGNVTDEEMYGTFNMGVGFIVVVSRDKADTVSQRLKANGESVYTIGEIVSGRGEVGWKK